jgi:capsular exopolysaccharide synthesis family protein
MIQQNILEALPAPQATRARPENSRSHPLFAYYEDLLARLRAPDGWPNGAPQAVGVTSCGRGHGVSTVSSNLAVAAQLIGHKIALVDAHLAHPSIAGAMAIPPSPGLSDYLDGLASLSECLHGHSLEDPAIMPAGTAMSAGSAPGDTALVPEAANTLGLVAALRNEFGLIIVDLPSLDEVAGCPAFANQLDGVLLVVAADRVTAPEVERAVEQLHQGGAKVLGVVLNAYRQQVPGWLHRRT